MIYNGSCIDLLNQMESTVPLIFADPPDNLGLQYDTYKDHNPGYYDFLELVMRKSLQRCRTFWISYYWEHDIEIKARVKYMLQRTAWEAKTFIWRYTFGQYNDKDFGSGFRYLLRFSRPDARKNADAVRVISERQKLGDKRAAGPRVPDDFWDIDVDMDQIQEIPRVTGNSKERCSWHPTQHPEELYERIVKFSSNEGDVVVDLFGGTGTMNRVARRLNRIPLISEISANYCGKIGPYTTEMSEVNQWMKSLPPPST